jgi:Lon protease-like protein
MDEPSAPSALSSPLPLFPLPNLVLFPRTYQVLHIFEERYKAMTADALAGDGHIAMALLRPGWEKDYHGRAAIEPVVCVGTIEQSEQLPDGKYNFLLLGRTRARVVREVPRPKPYRVAQLESLLETPVMEIDLIEHRQKLTDLFTSGALAATSLGRQFRQMLTSPMPTADIADVAAFNILDDIALKQSLLAETDVRSRVGRTIEALAKVDRVLAMTSHTDNPSMN